MDTYEFFDKVNSNQLADLDIQDYIQSRTNNNINKLRTLLSDLDKYRNNTIVDVVVDNYFNSKDKKKEPQKSLDNLRRLLELKIETEQPALNNLKSIPKVSVFSNSIYNTVFDKVLLRTLVNGTTNNNYYKNVFNHWVNIKIAHLQNTALVDQSEWVHYFLNGFCGELIDRTIRIAKGAHYYFKNDPNYNKYYDSGYIKLFWLLNYGNGQMDTIENHLEILRSKRAENLPLALIMQDYCIDRIIELKTMLEIRFFFKKTNPIFFHYDQIIQEFKNSIDYDREKIKLKNFGANPSRQLSKASIKIFQKLSLKEFFLLEKSNDGIVEQIQNRFKHLRNKDLAILIYLLDKKYKLIAIDNNSKVKSRKHFAESLTGSKIEKMQGINNHFQSITGDLKTIGKEDAAYVAVKSKLDEIVGDCRTNTNN